MTVSYDTRNVLSLLRYHGGPLPWIWSQLGLVAVCSVAATVMHSKWQQFAEEDALGTLEALSFILAPVAFLLVFRSNIAMELFWRGRGTVGALVLSAINLSRMASAYLAEAEVDVLRDAPLHRLCDGRLVADGGNGRGPPRLIAGSRWAGRWRAAHGDAPACLQLPVCLPPFASHFHALPPLTAVLPVGDDTPQTDSADLRLLAWGIDVDSSRVQRIAVGALSSAPQLQEVADAAEAGRWGDPADGRSSLWVLSSVGALVDDEWREEDWGSPHAGALLTEALRLSADLRVTLLPPDPSGCVTAPFDLLEEALRHCPSVPSVLLADEMRCRVNDQWLLSATGLHPIRQLPASAVPPPPLGRVVWRRDWVWEPRVVGVAGRGQWQQLAERPLLVPHSDADGELIKERRGGVAMLRWTLVRLVNVFVGVAVDELQHSGQHARALDPDSSEPAAPGSEAELMRWLAPDEARLLGKVASRGGQSAAAATVVGHWLSCCIAAAVRGAGLDEDVAFSMEQDVRTLLEAVADAVSTRRVPLPFPYVQMLNAGLVLLFVMMPFTLCFSYGAGTVPICLGLGVALFGTNAVGGELSDPFGDDPNDLPLDAVATAIANCSTAALLQRDSALATSSADLLHAMQTASGVSPIPFWRVIAALDTGKRPDGSGCSATPPRGGPFSANTGERLPTVAWDRLVV